MNQHYLVMTNTSKNPLGKEVSEKQDTPKTLTERVVVALSVIGVTKNAFYSRTGIGNGALDKVGGMQSQSIEKIVKEFPEINLYWLLLGEGEMLNTNKPTSIKSPISKEMGGSVKLLEMYERLDLAREEIITLSKEHNKKDETAREREEEIRILKKKISNLEKDIARIMNAKDVV